MDDRDFGNLSYKGYRSVTFSLVLLGFVTGTTLLVCQYITETTWRDAVLGLLSGYVIRDGISKVAEAYMMKKITGVKD